MEILLQEKWYAAVPEEKLKIAFVDFQREDTSVVLCLEPEGAAKEAIELLSGKLIFRENVFSTIEGFEGHEVTNYKQKIAEYRENIKRKVSGKERGCSGRRGRRR